MPGHNNCCDFTTVDQCSYCFDAFSRPNGTDIDTDSPCGWTEDAGAWSITDMALTTSSTGARAIANKKQPEAQAPEGHVVKVMVWGGAVSDLARVIVNYINATNFHYVEFGFDGTSSNVVLHKVNGGVDSALATVTGTAALAATTWLTVKVCFSDTSFIAEVAGIRAASADATIRLPAAGNDGPQAGVGTGGTASDVRFDNFEFLRHKAGCVLCSSSILCGDCIGLTPLALALTLPNLTNSTGGCDWCTSADSGIYILDHQYSSCCWSTGDITVNCPGLSITRRWGACMPGNTIRVDLLDPTGFGSISNIFNATITAGELRLGGVVGLTWTTPNTGGCDPGSSPVTVQALF